ncbi:MAG: response regulator [Chloroflexota bacterium]
MSPRAGGIPTIRCFPSADRAFSVAVDQAIDAIGDLSASDAASRLEHLLRQRYPSARVSPQDPLATFAGEPRVWYVYRRDAPPPDSGADTESGVAGLNGSGAVDETAPTPEAEPSAVRRTARPVYSAAAIATMVGVPLAILVGWDEDDGFVRPSPATTGHRLYSRDDLEDLLTVKRLTTAGRSADAIRSTLAEERARRAARPFGSSPSGHRMLVLLAERDPYAAEMAEYFLRTEGYDVEVSYSAIDAEAIAATRTPDVSVVELLLSGGAGAELCARLKARTGAVVVAISTLDFEDAALRSGADAFLRKPLDPLALVSTIRDLLGESALVRSSVTQ